MALFLHKLLFFLLSILKFGVRHGDSSVFVTAASTNYAYSAYQYDNTVAQFSPDGRLLQVEYASLAADHSFPVIVAPISSECTIMLTLRSSKQTQERLLVLEQQQQQQGKRGSNSCTTAVALSGVLADSLALIQKVHSESLLHRRLYGKVLSSQEVARTISTACQRHAFGGGLRPFGSTILIAGVEPSVISSGSSSSSIVRVQLSDSSGALQDLPPNRPVVVGGNAIDSLSRGSVQQRLNQNWKAICEGKQEDNSGDVLLADGIARMSLILLGEARNKKKETDDNLKGEEEDFLLEIVVVSATKGAYKLSQLQVEAILNRNSLSE